MQLKSFFPEEMIKSASSELSMETIAAKFSYFFEQIHLLHLQTPSHAEHSALSVWEDVVNIKDTVLEELMGYEGRKIKAYKIDSITDYSIGEPIRTLYELKDFAKNLQSFANLKGYSNIENLAQDLSGKAAKTLYLLTQS
jgi:hypothetical protein